MPAPISEEQKSRDREALLDAAPHVMAAIRLQRAVEHRGAALLAFKQALAAAGYEMAAEELPDYLPVVLELSARSGDEVASALLSSHREGIEVLRSALVDVDSPYARLVEAVSMTLPRIDAAFDKFIRRRP